MIRHNFALHNLALGPLKGKSTAEKLEPMPEDFVPGKNHVICGRGKTAYAHNEGFRSLVAKRLDEYSSAPSKPEKSRIVTIIFDQVMCKGGFVRQDTKTKRWLVVPEMPAREKISQAFRDCLADQYQSSKDCRQRRRKQAREEFSSDSDDEAREEATRVVKRCRAALPATPVNTSEALRQLLQFSNTIARDSLSSPPTYDCSPRYLNEEEPETLFGSKGSSFHPIQDDKTFSSKSKRCSLSDIGISFDSEEFVPFNALSA